MLTKLADLRVNFLITFAGAAIVILLIKTTPLLLPDKYYFNFSKLIAGASEPFIVDLPGVTGSRLCEVMKKYGVSDDEFRWRVSCDDDFERAVPFSSAEVDEIYRLAYKSDNDIRKAIADAGSQATIAPLPDAEIRRMASNESNQAGVFKAIVNDYVRDLSTLADRSVSTMIETLYQDLMAIPEQENPETPNPDISNPDAVSPLHTDEIGRLLEANRSLQGELNPAAYTNNVRPIGRAAIDDILKHLNGKAGLSSAIGAYYTNQMRTALRNDLTAKFASAGVTTDLAIQRKVFDEINKFSWQNYTVSILLRLTPVLLFGLVAGAMVGRGELFSISMAGGLAAFLLSWPLMLMWDRLVQSAWEDKRTIFLGFYSLYVVSFFFTARAAGVLGAWIREQRILSVPDGGAAQIRVKWGDVMVNLLIAIVFNGAVYAWNVYLPLTAGLAR